VNEKDGTWKDSFKWVCGTYLIILLLFVLLRIVASMEWVSRIDIRWVEWGFTFISQVLIMFAVPIISIIIYKKRNKINEKTFKSFGFDKPRARIILWAIVLGVLCYLFNIFVAGFFSGILTLVGFRFPATGSNSFVGIEGFIIAMIMVGVMPGVCEEVTHRGMLLKSSTAKMGTIRAVVLTALLFGFMHLNIVQMFYATILGIIIALAVVATKSIWVGIIIHFMNNGLGTYFSFAHRYEWAGNTELGWFLSNVAGSLMFYVLSVILLYVCIMHIIRYKFNLSGAIKPAPSKIKLDAGERTLLSGIIFLGLVITGMTLVWGLL